MKVFTIATLCALAGCTQPVVQKQASVVPQTQAALSGDQKLIDLTQHNMDIVWSQMIRLKNKGVHCSIQDDVSDETVVKNGPTIYCYRALQASAK